MRAYQGTTRLNSERESGEKRGKNGQNLYEGREVEEKKEGQKSQTIPGIVEKVPGQCGFGKIDDQTLRKFKKVRNVVGGRRLQGGMSTRSGACGGGGQ